MPLNTKGTGSAKGVSTTRNVPAIRVIASLERIDFQSVQQKVAPRHPLSSSLGHIPLYSDEAPAPTCEDELPTSDAFTIREYGGKLVRDVWMDTHDLLNEPGGFIINLAKHGEEVSKQIKIHLGIHQKRHPKPTAEAGDNAGKPVGAPNETTPQEDLITPGTITPTDDYAREIFRGIRAHPELESVSAVLEISDKDDLYEQKFFEETSPSFLRAFIQTYPTNLTIFHVEMPGLSAVYLPEWKFILEQQLSLQVLICNFGVVLWTFYEKGVLRNSRTLERIVLRRLQTYDSASGQYVPFDWSIFAECDKLSHLKITCGYRPDLKNFISPASAGYHPASVFMHENMDSLPDHEAFKELHLSRIWIDSCTLKDFSDQRPNLQLCLECHDMEYYDADLTLEDIENNDFQSGGLKHLNMISISRLDLAAEISQDVNVAYLEQGGRAAPKHVRSRHHHHRSSDKKLGCIVLIFFQIILTALAILFIIIYFRHWRRRGNSVAVAAGEEKMEAPFDNNETFATTEILL